MRIIYFYLFILLFICKTPYAQFSDVADEWGVDHKYINGERLGGGVAIFDVNNDKLLDLFVVGGLSPNALYINNGNGFDLVTEYLVVDDLAYYRGDFHGVCAGDVNNDGFNDLILCTSRNFSNLVLLNNGNSRFKAAPIEQLGGNENKFSISAALGDINKDGFLDVFIGSYIDQSDFALDSLGNTIFIHKAFANDLYLNQGDGTFINVTEDYQLSDSGTTFLGAFTDFDNDNDVDLYVINDFGHDVYPNELYMNNYPQNSFQDISQSSGADIGMFAMGVAIGDYDGDLDLDYYVTNLGRNVLLQNNGDRTFIDVTNHAGVQDSLQNDSSPLNDSSGLKTGWGTGFFDYDNDKDLDLFVSNGHILSARELFNPLYNQNTLFLNEGDGSFRDVSLEMNMDDGSNYRGGAYGDLDLDGDLDVVFVAVSQEGELDTIYNKNVAVYINEIDNSKNAISLILKGTVSNPNAYGAHVYLYDTEGAVQLREVDGGSTHASSNSPYVHFGLGTAKVDSIVIFWPNGYRQTEYSLTENQLHTIWESIGITKDTIYVEVLSSGNVDTTINLSQSSALPIGFMPNAFFLCSSGSSINAVFDQNNKGVNFNGENIEPTNEQFCIVMCEDNSCDTTVIDLTIIKDTTVTPIFNNQLAGETKLFPTPSQNFVRIEIPLKWVSQFENLLYELHSLEGKKVLSGELNAPISNANVAKIKSGMYLLNIVGDNNVLDVVKLIKE